MSLMQKSECLLVGYIKLKQLLTVWFTYIKSAAGHGYCTRSISCITSAARTHGVEPTLMWVGQPCAVQTRLRGGSLVGDTNRISTPTGCCILRYTVTWGWTSWQGLSCNDKSHALGWQDGRLQLDGIIKTAWTFRGTFSKVGTLR